MAGRGGRSGSIVEQSAARRASCSVTKNVALDLISPADCRSCAVIDRPPDAGRDQPALERGQVCPRPATGKVHVRLFRKQEELRVSVSDNGPGIRRGIRR